jgi:hypothetical protein
MRRQSLNRLSLWAASIAILVCVLVFQLKHQVMAVERELGCVNREILDTTDAIRVLKAEWSHLNQPDRLKKLNMAHLRLKPVQVIQMASLESLSLDREGSPKTTMLASL